MKGAFRIQAVTLLAIGAAVAACEPEPVRWDDERPVAGVIETGARLSLQPGAVPVLVAPWSPPAQPVALACPMSFDAVRAAGDTAYAAWWVPRADSTALLVVARSDDGGNSWRAPVVADSTDTGRTGCSRQVPYVAADSLNGYVQVVYFLQAAEGPGLFFTHSMEHGTMFHSPVPIVYGERVSAGAVVSRGDTVAVAYENPNAEVPQIWLALSATTGHIFERREQVSTGTARTTRPSIALRDGRLAVAWYETERGTNGPASRVARVGELRP
jgi:hypothetical protein